ncbi:MAG: hypothetical protein JXA46_11540 [Dehalococcoidales bacterium]|nr:hypothetical protein [Dehalococcoidales bacterium]
MRPQMPGKGQYFDCEIRLKNHLDKCWQAWFEGLRVNNLDDGEVLVSGSIPDQAALFGLLNRIRDLNLKVVSLNVRAQ